MASLTLTYGPLLFGGAAALILSGIVSVQCLIYFKSYSQRGIKKAKVLVVWILDVLQSAFILASLCHYFVTHFGDTSVLAVIPWSVASLLGPFKHGSCIYFTPGQSSDVHRHLSTYFKELNEVRELISKREELGYHVACRTLRNPPAALSIPQWTAFINLDTGTKSRTKFMFTMGLTISAGTDIGIAICLCYYLRKIRRLSSSSIMKGVFDTLMIYTVENGLLTSITTIATLIRELREMHSGDQGIHFDPSVRLANYYTQFPHCAPAMSQATTPLAAPAPIHDYHPLFKMHQVPNPTRRDSVQISDFQIQSFSPPRSRRASIEHWSILP
ncbi:hypothetical protein B0H13DRAFT_2317719 [Mycena leptocephala]|nr:hypothetical protein B0H13DRAFT_2317719 [Mycena leptocephala]